MKSFVNLMIVLSFNIGILSAQEEENDLGTMIEEFEEYLVEKEIPKTKRTKEIGINLTRFVTQFIPFNEDVAFDGPFALNFRTGKDGNMFNFQIGARFRPDDFGSSGFINIGIGYLKKKAVSKRFHYYTSYNLLFSSGSFNLQDDQNEDGGAAGVTFGLGFEYNINSVISIGTETIFFIGTRDANFTVTIVPPIALYLTGKLKKQYN